MNTCVRVLAASAAAVVFHAAAPCTVLVHADVVFTGSAHLTGAPASVEANVWESNHRTRVFQEQSGLVLGEDLHVDITAFGRVDDTSDMTPGTIDAGTRVDSWFVHQDVVGPRGNLFLKGSITFDQEILGVIVNRESLLNSDGPLGNPGTVYPLGLFPRGLDFGQDSEKIKVSADRHTLKFNLYTTTVMDQIRVITAAAPVPAPAAATLLLGGLLTRGRRRRAE